MPDRTCSTPRVRSRGIDGRYRYSFWGEIYDNVLLFHIIGPTLLALINPKAGSFNVTAKGGVLEKELYDTPIMRPLMILAVVLLAAIGVGFYRLLFTELFPGDAPGALDEPVLVFLQRLHRVRGPRGRP